MAIWSPLTEGQNVAKISRWQFSISEVSIFQMQILYKIHILHIFSGLCFTNFTKLKSGKSYMKKMHVQTPPNGDHPVVSSFSHHFTGINYTEQYCLHTSVSGLFSLSLT